MIYNFFILRLSKDQENIESLALRQAQDEALI